jgi:hypothetical protein
LNLDEILCGLPVCENSKIFRYVMAILKKSGSSEFQIADSNTSALRTGADDITNLNGH